MQMNPPAKEEIQVQFLGQEDQLEKQMATHSSILAWEIPWMGSLVGCSPWGRKESDTTEQLNTANVKTRQCGYRCRFRCRHRQAYRRRYSFSRRMPSWLMTQMRTQLGEKKEAKESSMAKFSC